MKISLDEKIARLEGELKNAKAEKTQEQRKERNNQLMAFGFLLETKYKTLSETEQAKIKAWVEILDERNKARALAGFSRLDTAPKQDTPPT